jgi:hypothetical protein
MESFWFVLGTALRATVWRATHQARTVGLPALLAWSLAAIGAGIAYEYASAGTAARFNPYGLNSAFAETAVILAVASMFVSARLRATFLSTLCAIGLVITAVKLLSVFNCALGFRIARQSSMAVSQSADRTLCRCVDLVDRRGLRDPA